MTGMDAQWFFIVICKSFNLESSKNNWIELESAIIKDSTNPFWITKIHHTTRNLYFLYCKLLPREFTKKRNMRESSKPIECMQIVQLHENKIDKQDEEKMEWNKNAEKKEFTQYVSFAQSFNMNSFFPHFAQYSFFNLIWFDFTPSFSLLTT